MSYVVFECCLPNAHTPAWSPSGAPPSWPRVSEHLAGTATPALAPVDMEQCTAQVDCLKSDKASMESRAVPPASSQLLARTRQAHSHDAAHVQHALHTLFAWRAWIDGWFLSAAFNKIS